MCVRQTIRAQTQLAKPLPSRPPDCPISLQEKRVPSVSVRKDRGDSREVGNRYELVP